jgi:hypothetical protein
MSIKPCTSIHEEGPYAKAKHTLAPLKKDKENAYGLTNMVKNKRLSTEFRAKKGTTDTNS